MFIYTYAKQRKQRGDFFREHFIFLFLPIDRREITKSPPHPHFRLRTKIHTCICTSPHCSNFSPVYIYYPWDRGLYCLLR
jgi:hypothetical protein